MNFIILIVENNIFFRQALRDILHHRFPEINIRLARNREECMALLKEFEPDILFIDIQFHDKDGIELIRLARRNYPSTVIVIFTEYDIDEYRTATLLAGGNYIIPKVLWTGNEILALVETIMTNKGFPRPETEPWPLAEQDFLKRPLERRKNNQTEKGQFFEREYLKSNRDRRRKTLLK